MKNFELVAKVKAMGARPLVDLSNKTSKMDLLMTMLLISWLTHRKIPYITRYQYTLSFGVTLRNMHEF